jgi:hypothetical protein
MECGIQVSAVETGRHWSVVIRMLLIAWCMITIAGTDFCGRVLILTVAEIKYLIVRYIILIFRGYMSEAMTICLNTTTCMILRGIRMILLHGMWVEIRVSVVVVRYNVFENVGRPDRRVMCIYLDDGACGVEVHGNVFYNTASRASVFTNSGHDVKVTNNIFVKTQGPAVEINSIFYNMSEAHLAHFFDGPKKTMSINDDKGTSEIFAPSLKGLFEYRLLECVDVTKPPYSERYPELVNYMEYLDDGVTRVGMRPSSNVMTKNVVYKCPEALRLTGPHAKFTEKDSYVTDADPGFVDAANRNFMLKDNSIVHDTIKDFEPIPFEKIGRK